MCGRWAFMQQEDLDVRHLGSWPDTVNRWLWVRQALVDGAARARALLPKWRPHYTMLAAAALLALLASLLARRREGRGAGS